MNQYFFTAKKEKKIELNPKWKLDGDWVGIGERAYLGHDERGRLDKQINEEMKKNKRRKKVT